MADRRSPPNARDAAEALFAKKAPKIEGPAKAAAIPGVKETVTLRIDQDVLAFFQEDGPGWQDRINAALRIVAGK